MRIHVLAFGSLGDVLPLAALGAELARRGHAVTVRCGRLHAPRVEAMGLPVVPLDSDALPAIRLQRYSVFGTPRLWRRVEHAAQQWHDQLAAEVGALRASEPPPLLVASTFALAGRLLQERLGLKLATVHLSPIWMMSFREPPVVGDLAVPAWLPPALRSWLGRTFERLVVDRVTAPGLNAIRQRLGLAPVRQVFSRWMHSPDLVLGLFPAWFAAPQPDWPRARLFDFPMVDGADREATVDDLRLDAFLRAGAPPVVFYPGSARREASDFFAQAIDACGRLGRRAVLLTRYREQVPPDGALPASVLHCAYLSFGKLLPRAAALVHCGGIGTVAQALRAGCPQLLLPHHFDQFDNAARLRALGLARVHRGANWSAALDALLRDTELARACAAWADKVPDGRSALAAAAQAIEALAPVGIAAGRSADPGSP